METKKTFRLAALFLTVLMFVSVLAACGVKRNADTLYVGSTQLPKNLMPYDANTGSTTFITGMIYDSLLNTLEEPVESYLPAGAEIEQLDDIENPFRFSDLLVGAEGAYPKKEGSDVGREIYNGPELAGWRTTLLRAKGLDIKTPAEQEAAIPSSDWLKYTFKVIDGHLWSDGTPFTAEDIKFTFDYIVKYSGAIPAQANFLYGYSHSTVRGQYIDIYLATRSATDIRFLCNSILIIPKHKWETITNPGAQSNTSNPVGTGYYKLADRGFKAGNSVTLELRSDYPAKLKEKYVSPGAPKNIIVVGYGSVELMLSALEKGSIDVIHEQIEASQEKQIKDKTNLYKNVKIGSSANDFVTTLCFNLKRFGDDQWGTGTGKALRQAVSLAINQNTLITNVLYGNGSTCGDGMVMEGQPHALTDGEFATHKTDVAKANQILDAAGFTKGTDGWRRTPTGQTLSINILGQNTGRFDRTATALIEMMDAIKVKFTYTKGGSDYANVIKQKEGANFDTIINEVALNFSQLMMFEARFGYYKPPQEVGPKMYNYSGTDDQHLRDMMDDMLSVYNTPQQQVAKAKDVQNYIASLYAEIPVYSRNMVAAYSDKYYKGWVPAKGTYMVENNSTWKYITKVK